MVYFERRGFTPHGVEKVNIDKTYELAKNILEADRIDPQKLKDCDERMVNRDMQYVRDRKAQFEKESTPESRRDKKMATIMEVIINEQVELNDWLGPNAETVTSSQYDDIANGVDGIIRLQSEREGDTDYCLAVDVTFSADSTHIRGKFNKILENIEKGQLTEIKYFAVPDLEGTHEYEYKGSVKMPRVVIGIERQVVEKLGDLWFKKNKKELGSHPVQHVIAKEILDQLAVSEQYARSHGNRNNIAAVYRRVSGIIEGSLKEKEDGGDYMNGFKPLKNDRVLGAITTYLDDVVTAMR